MSTKFKILFPLVLLVLLVLTKYILWDFPVSDGKRVGNLTKISKKGKIFKTWEGTIDEGSGEQLTSRFSVKDEKLAQELYDYKGRQVIIYYEEHLVGFPRDTKYVVSKWEAGGDLISAVQSIEGSSSTVNKLLSKTLFCSLLGALYQDQKLYNEVKEHIKKTNSYLYNQYEKCND